MKRLVITTLSAIALATIATPTLAGEVAAVNNTPIRNVVEVTPFNLVTHGYQGYFANQGIPSNGVFVSQVKTGKVKAETLVQAAIASGRLTSDKIDDTIYLHHVRSQLANLDRN